LDYNHIAVIGLGKLGSCLAAGLASKKNKVSGVDINKRILNYIQNKKSPFEERGLDELLKLAGSDLTVDSNIESAVSRSEITFLVLPTPSRSNGKFSLKYILDTIPDIAKGIHNTIHKYPVIVLTSTVMPGDCEKYIIPALEKHTSKKCGNDFGFCYNPEFIALGSIIHDMQNPDMVLIGESDAKAGRKLLRVYKTFIENKPAYQVMNIINAEIVKLSINTFVTTKISYANMLTQICNETKGANIDTVTSALGKDSRIGMKYLKGGASYGGPCFPRDNMAFVKMASDKSINAYIAKATDSVNNQHVKYICKEIYKTAGKEKRIGILGVSYKPDTPMVEKSAGVLIAEKLIKKKYQVSYFDPMVKKSPLPSMRQVSSMKKILKNSDIIILLNNDKQYASIEPRDINRNTIIMDCWRILNEKKWKDHTNWYRLGISK